jgi:antitoxin component of MazEF toxin-antitoxin module
MIVDLREIGNSKGIIIPKKVLEKTNFIGIKELKLEIKNGKLIIRKPKKNEKI